MISYYFYFIQFSIIIFMFFRSKVTWIVRLSDDTFEQAWYHELKPRGPGYIYSPMD